MNDLKLSVLNEFDIWKNLPPNIIQRGTGFIFKPVGFILKPFIKKIAPLLEGVVKGANQYISEVIQKWTGEIIDIYDLNDHEFEEWLHERDKVAKNWANGGIAAMIAEGAGTGLGGFALLAADIPASFGLIIGFSNKISLSYQLDITNEEVQVEILKAIAVGSETSLDGKITAVSTMKSVSNIIEKTTWKAMADAPAQSLPKLIINIRTFLQKLGINITKRKAGQLLPIIGAVSGGVINGSWAADSLEAVRQLSRLSVVESYYSKRNEN